MLHIYHNFKRKCQYKRPEMEKEGTAEKKGKVEKRGNTNRVFPSTYLPRISHISVRKFTYGFVLRTDK